MGLSLAREIAYDTFVAVMDKRRKPEDSEITISDLENLLGNQLFDKICCLEDPYPNAFIKTKDGKKLLIKLAELE